MYRIDWRLVKRALAGLPSIDDGNAKLTPGSKAHGNRRERCGKTPETSPWSKSHAAHLLLTVAQSMEERLGIKMHSFRHSDRRQYFHTSPLRAQMVLTNSWALIL